MKEGGKKVSLLSSVLRKHVTYQGLDIDRELLLGSHCQCQHNTERRAALFVILSTVSVSTILKGVPPCL